MYEPTVGPASDRSQGTQWLTYKQGTATATKIPINNYIFECKHRSCAITDAVVRRVGTLGRLQGMQVR
jgi:hypothetical protein